MRIAILGGTGTFGKGLALRLARRNEIILGSRDREKAKATAISYLEESRKFFPNISGSIIGDDNIVAAKSSELLFFCLKLEPALELARSLRTLISEQIVVSPIVDINDEAALFSAPYPSLESLTIGNIAQGYLRPSISCAEALAGELGLRDQVISALHIVPADSLRDLAKPVNSDVFVCGDDLLNVKVVSKLIEEINGVRAFYAGPLRFSLHIEGMAVALRAVSKYSKLRNPTFKIP